MIFLGIVLSCAVDEMKTIDTILTCRGKKKKTTTGLVESKPGS